jgi:DNA-binding PadR family transcriptional regulator
MNGSRSLELHRCHANIVSTMRQPAPLGEFEVLVLLAVLQLDGQAVGTSILEEIQRRTGRKVARGAIYVTLDRLEHKSLLSSRLDDASPERGGHPRRFFKVTEAGLKGLRHSLDMVARMRAGLEPLLGKS